MKMFVLLFLQLFFSAAVTLAEIVSNFESKFVLHRGCNKEYGSFASVPGARICGGHGQFIDLRMESCNAAAYPCHMEDFNSPRRLELVFIPSTNIAKLRRRSVTKVDGKLVSVFEGNIRNSNVTKGERELYGIRVFPWEEYNGKVVTIQISLINVVDGGVEICAEGDLRYDGVRNFAQNKSPCLEPAKIVFALLFLIHWIRFPIS